MRLHRPPGFICLGLWLGISAFFLSPFLSWTDLIPLPQLQRGEVWSHRTLPEPGKDQIHQNTNPASSQPQHSHPKIEFLPPLSTPSSPPCQRLNCHRATAATTPRTWLQPSPATPSPRNSHSCHHPPTRTPQISSQPCLELRMLRESPGARQE